jgi:hypothetical protein
MDTTGAPHIMTVDRDHMLARRLRVSGAIATTRTQTPMLASLRARGPGGVLASRRRRLAGSEHIGFPLHGTGPAIPKSPFPFVLIVLFSSSIAVWFASCYMGLFVLLSDRCVDVWETAMEDTTHRKSTHTTQMGGKLVEGRYLGICLI